jgi:hypothetical protein
MRKTFVHLPVKLPKIKATTFKTGERLYKVGDKSFPSVTTVLAEHSREGIEKWRKKVGPSTANFLSEQGRTRGDRFHGLTEDYLRNKPYQKPETFLEIDAFQDVIPYLERIDNIRVLEGGLYSQFLRMAGRVDCIAEFDGVLSVIDFKTAKKPKQSSYIHSYYMQTAAYAIMFEELTGIPINRTVIIIAVDGQGTQLFQEKRDPWVKDLIKYRDIYESKQKAA